jgi:hypothetical protein
MCGCDHTVVHEPFTSQKLHVGGDEVHLRVKSTIPLQQIRYQPLITDSCHETAFKNVVKAPLDEARGRRNDGLRYSHTALLRRQRRVRHLQVFNVLIKDLWIVGLAE